LRGSWPLVVANIRAAELMALAPMLVRRVASGGRLILSGIPHGVTEDVDRVYCRLGMRRVATDVRDGWASLVVCPSW
jgi:ribosomal protein L11 methyltransferase